MPTTTSVLLIVIAVGAALRLRKGYVRRKPHWTRDSWRRFLGGLALIGSAVLLPLLMGIAVDAGLYRWIGASHTFRGLWVTAIIVSMIGGITAGVVVINWFANGEPARPCPPVFSPSHWRDP